MIEKNIYLEKIFRNNLVQVYSFFLVAIFIRYNLPYLLGDVFFLGLLVIFFLSKKNYFFLALFFLLIEAPGYLFFKNGLYHLPEIRIATFDRSIFYEELIVFIAIIKSLLIKNKRPLFYRPAIYLLFSYILLLFIVTYIYGTPFIKLLRTIRFVIPFSLFIVIPKLIRRSDEFIKFSKIVFSFVFVLFAAQLLDIISGFPIAFYFGERLFIFSGSELDVTSKLFDVSSGPVRSIYGVHVLLFSFILSLFYLEDKKRAFRKNYLYLVVGTAYLAVFLSATRTWILAFSFMIIIYLILYPKKIRMSIIVSLILVLLMLSSPLVYRQIQKSIVRFKTIESLLRGDMTAGGTLTRFSERSPRVMNKFYESPVVGFGYSQEFYNYADGHVGNQTLLLNGGVLGYLVYVFLWWYFLKKIWIRSKIYGSRNLKIFIIGFLGLFIIHSSAMIFSYSLQVSTALMLSLIFSYANYYYFYIKRQYSIKA